MPVLELDFATLMMLLPSCILFVAAIHFLWYDLTAWKSAKEVTGKVVGIEHYTSTYRSNNQTRRQSYYRPVVEFQWNGKTYKIAGASISEMHNRLYDDIAVFVREDYMGEILDATVKTRILKVFASGCFLIGAVMLGFLVNEAQAEYKDIGLVFTLVFIASLFLKNTIKIKPHFKQWQPKEDGRLIDTAHEQMEEVSRNTKSGFIVASVFLLIGLAMVYGAYNGLPLDGQNAVRQDVFAVIQQAIDGQIPPSWEEELILGAMGSFFTMLALYSLAYTNRQSRRR